MNRVLIYENSDNQAKVEVKIEGETLWLDQNQLAVLFNTDRTAILRHIQNIYSTGELPEKSTCVKFAQVQEEGKRKVKRNILHYNLDVIISVGYRVNSKQGTQFRIWSTQRLKEYLTQGYAINKDRIQLNKSQFLKTIEDLKLLTKDIPFLEVKDVLDLIQNFSSTWFSLEQFDSQQFPKEGTQKEIEISAKELNADIRVLKQELINKGEATELFAQEKREGSLEGIFGSVFQSVFGEDAYPTIEEKAANLLYFIVKNHPFNDGNKRSGAFSFIWLLQKAGMDFISMISAQTLTTLTILIAESNPNEKDKMIGLILLLLNKENNHGK